MPITFVKDFPIALTENQGRFGRLSGNKKTISFINLTGNEEDFWNKGKIEPPVVKDLKIKLRVLRDVKSLFLASPDTDMGRPHILQYKEIPEDLGMMIEITIPEVKLFSLLVLEQI